MARHEISSLRNDLAVLEERLADLALELLHEALGDPDPRASGPAKAEKIVTRARRSVAKASDLLGSLEGADAEE